MLHITSCRRAETAPSECLELARLIDRRTVLVVDYREEEPVSPRQRHTIVEALRAFA